jgi:DegV family protein with EDD domain
VTQSNFLNGNTWFQAICNGAERLIAHSQWLNKINVFPVADGDTGNNLTSLMRSIIQYGKPAQNFYQTALSIAKASLIGARGNSGTIFSQFFYGFVTTPATDELSLEEFCILVQQAAASAKQAVDRPANGTILSVMEEWAAACGQLKNSFTNIADLLQASLAFAEQALKSTTEKLEVLSRANVVDAGAQGFFYFLEGVVEALKNPELKHQIPLETISLDLFDEDHVEMTYPEKRYCTEALICDATLTLAEIKNLVSDLGDSMAMAGNNETSRLHIHTNHPEEIMARLQKIARIEQQKADDMLRQYQMTQHKTHKIALVTDSTADIPQALIDHYQIHVIPLQLQVDQSFYLDRLTMSSEYIYGLMQDEQHKHNLTTSMPNPNMTERMLRQLQSHYDDILIISLADKLSGTHQLIKSSAEKLKIPSIKIIDSVRTSGALGLLVLEAANMIEQQKSFEEIARRIEQLKLSCNLHVAVNDLQYMMRSGRLSKAKGHIVQALKIKPIVSMDRHGKAVVSGKAFGFRAALDKLIQALADKKNHLIDYAVVHADRQGIAERLAKKLTVAVDKPPRYIMSASAVLGIHTGPGCVAVAFLLDE